MPAARTRLLPAALAIAALVLLMSMSTSGALAQAPEPLSAEHAGTVTPHAVDARALPPTAAVAQPVRPHLHPEGEEALERAKIQAAPSSSTPSGLSQPAPLTPSAGIGFDGIDDVESGCGCTPPDGAIAVGPSQVVAAVNTALKVWDKGGDVAAGYPKSLASLFSGGGCYSGISDPFAEYDRVAGRYIVGAETFDHANNSIVCIAASVSGDPTGIWQIYAFPAAGTHEVFDFPHAAIGSDALYVSGTCSTTPASLMSASTRIRRPRCTWGCRQRRCSSTSRRTPRATRRIL